LDAPFFPLGFRREWAIILPVQRSGDAEAQPLANEAVERINIAMKEAAIDVYAMKINYGAPARPEIVSDQRIA
jgi:hypothetical protein